MSVVCCAFIKDDGTKCQQPATCVAQDPVCGWQPCCGMCAPSGAPMMQPQPGQVVSS